MTGHQVTEPERGTDTEKERLRQRLRSTRDLGQTLESDGDLLRQLWERQSVGPRKEPVIQAMPSCPCMWTRGQVWFLFPSPTITAGGIEASISRKCGLFSMLLSVSLEEGKDADRVVRGLVSTHTPREKSSKQLSGIILVKLIIIITRTQSRKKNLLCHHKYSFPSLWIIVPAMAIPESWRN